MPFISIRELLRDPKRVFSEIEEKDEPFVVTRRGQPVAALIPVTPSLLENFALAAAPEFLASRREAEHARAEGRTKPLEHLVQRLDAEDGEETPAPEPRRDELTRDLAGIFGAPLAEEMSTTAEARIAELTEMMINAVAKEADAEVVADADVARLRAANAWLFERLLHHLVSEATAGVVAGLGAEALTPSSVNATVEGVFGRGFAEQALDQVTDRVRSLNERIVVGQEAGEFSPSTYEATLRGIDVLMLRRW